MELMEKHNSDAPRDDFRALMIVPGWVKTLETDAQQADVFTPGIASSKNGKRGVAINTAVYGYDDAQQLAVIQVRECRFRQGRYNRVRKDYYLLGRVEDGSVFAHPVDSPVRSKTALSSPEACVRWVLAGIWDCAIEDLPEIRRQGDIAFIPATLPNTARPLVQQTVTIRGTHTIVANRLWQDGDTYYVSKKARAIHTKGEHAPIKTNGVFRVQPGIRARVWGFTAPCGD